MQKYNATINSTHINVHGQSQKCVSALGGSSACEHVNTSCSSTVCW